MPIESFQNQTLRPILKFQHELTIALLKNHRNYKIDQVPDSTRDKYAAFLSKYVQSNLDLKNQLLGVILGFFTTDEMSFYKDQRKELNRRIIQMQLKRYVDTAFSVTMREE